jgi:hypothetical protein
MCDGPLVDAVISAGRALDGFRTTVDAQAPTASIPGNPYEVLKKKKTFRTLIGEKPLGIPDPDGRERITFIGPAPTAEQPHHG